MRKYIENILQDFYDCTGMTVGAFDRFDQYICVYPAVTLCPFTEEESMRAVHEALEAQHACPESRFLIHRCNLSGEAGAAACLTVCYIDPVLPELGAFVFGPFAVHRQALMLPYKPVHAIEHLVTLLRSIAASYLQANSLPEPEQPPGSDLLRQMTRYIHDNLQRRIELDQAAQALGYSKSYLCRAAKRETGMTFAHYANHLRVERSKLLLPDATLSLTDVALAVGFNSQSYYCRVFRQFTGHSPQSYRALRRAAVG